MKRFSLTALILGGVLLLASCYQYMFIPVDIGNNSSQNENAWDGSTVDTSWYNPETNVFAITAPEQLAGLSALVNAETENFDGKTIVLGDDINLNGEKWTAIGRGDRKQITEAAAFKGTFNGNGHVISGLSINEGGTGKEDNGAYGFFGITDGATIENVTFENADVRGKTSSAGVAVGYGNNTNLKNVIVMDSYVSSAEGAGGIAGRIYTNDSGTYEISGCKSIGNTVIATESFNAGGLIGAINAATGSAFSVTENLVDMSEGGKVQSAVENVGGIIGNTANIDTLTDNSIYLRSTTDQIVLINANSEGRYLRGLIYGNGGSYFDTDAGNTVRIGTEETTVAASTSDGWYNGNNWISGSTETKNNQTHIIENTFAE